MKNLTKPCLGALVFESGFFTPDKISLYKYFVLS